MSVKIRETIKSIILVVLLLTTILLLYLVFAKDNKLDLSKVLPFLQTEETAEVASKELVIPQSVIYTSPNGDSLSVQDRKALYDKLCSYLSNFGRQGTSMVTEIPEEQLTKAIEESQSIEFNFGYSIPFIEYCNTYDIKKTNGYSTIKNLSSIILSDASKESIFIKDDIEKKYYRILAENAEGWDDAVLGGTQPEGDFLYTIDQVLGVNNSAIIPVQVKRNIEEVYFYYEKFVEGSFELDDIAESIFGETISFVRKVKDSFGNLTYMYGYGDKTLTVTADGTIEYKNSNPENKSSNGFYEDLQTAVNFVSACGGWQAKYSEVDFRLTNVETAGEGSSAIYTFYFTECLDGEDIAGDDSVGITVSVEKGQVSYYYRSAIIAIKSYGPKEDVTEAANAISDIAGTGEEYIRTVMNVKGAKTCYKMEGSLLIPSWQIEFLDGSKAWIGLKQKQY